MCPSIFTLDWAREKAGQNQRLAIAKRIKSDFVRLGWRNPLQTSRNGAVHRPPSVVHRPPSADCRWRTFFVSWKMEESFFIFRLLVIICRAGEKRFHLRRKQKNQPSRNKLVIIQTFSLPAQGNKGINDLAGLLTLWLQTYLLFAFPSRRTTVHSSRFIVHGKNLFAVNRQLSIWIGTVACLKLS